MRKFLIVLFLPAFIFSFGKELPLGLTENLNSNLQFYEIHKEIPNDLIQKKGAPLQVGIPVSLNLDLKKIGNLTFLRDGKVVWQYGFEAPSFKWLSFEFENFKIPEGAKFFIYKDEIFFKEFKPKGEEIFVIPPFPSNKCVLEVDFDGEIEPFEIKISNIVLGFEDFLSTRSSGDCQVDINCPEGADWQKEKKSVAIVYFSGYLCTGSLINNARYDCKNYFLIANHCIHTETNANKAIFYWDFEALECDGLDFSYEDYSKGSTLRATNSRSDFTLLELNEQPPEEYGLYYSGWTIDPNPATGAVVIHHPSGDVKKISIEEHTLIRSGNFWKVPHYEVGATEPGSSGSPLYNMNHKIIGQLYGGVSACGNPRNQMWDVYGAFYISWDSGSTKETRLKDWLDPDGTGVMEVEGMDSKVCYKRHSRPF